ncbi:beta-lactamase/transpeptidase-like protein [Helicostylum pulchrum]|nr:beta-lactamase/transpeptidase-like protein [Helicostylum pulchrum]
MISFRSIISISVLSISYFAYNMAVKAPYSSLSCSFIGIDCPSYIPMHGFVVDEYKEVYNMFLNNFKRGKDMGASISAYVDGIQVLSLQGGWKDQKNKIEYTNETLQMVFSCTKTLSSIIVAQLVEQGLLAYEERIATYWPEFSQGNKENVTLEDLMRHRSGMACLDSPLSYENASNPDTLADILAKQSHNFDGKAVHAYHAITQGWIQNEIIRRVDPENRTIDDFARTFKEKWGSEWYLKPDVTKELDLKRISPFYSKSVYQQILPLIKVSLDPRQDNSIVLDWFRKNSFVTRALRNPHMDQYFGVMNTNITHRSVEGPSYSGHTNADSIAKLAAILANRGKSIVPGEPDLFMKDTTFDTVSQYIDDYETDIILPLVPFVNLKGGWMLFPNQHFFKLSDQERSAEFMGGMGASGSLFAFNEKYKIGFGYVTNGYSGTSGIDERSIDILRFISEHVKNQKLL